MAAADGTTSFPPPKVEAMQLMAGGSLAGVLGLEGQVRWGQGQLLWWEVR